MTVELKSLPDLYASIRNDLGVVQGIIAEELTSRHPAVNELCKHLANYHGKMLRPALVLLSGQAAGGTRDTHHTLAAVVEIVHLATLLHDDVLDEADMRRQHQTINAMRNNETAVLLGDFLISHAYHLCSSLNDQFAARSISATTNVVCEGEIIEVSNRHNDALTEDAYLEIIQAKTAALTATCCALGAHYASDDPNVETALREFGMSAGIAFQIVDDVLDVMGNEATTGKSAGRDLEEGSATLPIIHAIANADTTSANTLRAYLRGHQVADMRFVHQAMEQTGSVEYAMSVARGYVQSALEQLSHLPESSARDSLTTMAEFILRRQA